MNYVFVRLLVFIVPRLVILALLVFLVVLGMVFLAHETVSLTAHLVETSISPEAPLSARLIIVSCFLFWPVLLCGLSLIKAKRGDFGMSNSARVFFIYKFIVNSCYRNVARVNLLSLLSAFFEWQRSTLRLRLCN